MSAPAMRLTRLGPRTGAIGNTMEEQHRDNPHIMHIKAFEILWNKLAETFIVHPIKT